MFGDEIGMVEAAASNVIGGGRKGDENCIVNVWQDRV